MLTSPALFAFSPQRTICLSSGPIDNIAQSAPEFAEEVPFVLATGFFSVTMLNNSPADVVFEARFYQTDGPGAFEVPPGTWPKAKQLNYAGKRDPVPPGGSNLLNSDWTDDPEPVYGYEVQVKITTKGNRPIRRGEVLLNGYARKAENLEIVPEHRLLNTEWTEIACSW
jgi:hypothetical protein